MSLKIEKTVINVKPHNPRCGYVCHSTSNSLMIVKANYILIDEANDIDGIKWYSVKVTDEVGAWLYQNFKRDIDFITVNQLKGVWIDMPEHIYILLKLKWT